MEYSNSDHINFIRNGNEAAFEKIFKMYFKNLHAFAYTFMKDTDIAEEIVQNVFFRIWEKKDQLQIDDSLKAYLYRSVHNESLNHIKHLKVKNSFQLQYSDHMESSDPDASSNMMASELENDIQKAINELPQQCRTIFQMSRFEQLKYQQIADQLNISIKTVENQMGKALRVLRTKLVEYLPFLLFLYYLIRRS
ncbi:RNA polymerase sigma-70 factor [Flavobacterium piscisymbiosum]|uniref:RNA polymerase sigma-70 factor n=1 Tax=Flavobacterium piscisymbiosum TaxID=2893753 RepID=A0ABS8MIP5_9FLAO|nr:RNA polymerase sigma-70 factor [Flavobacterium sp. F-30]MCC9065344.1 RNA polymerase sigma-70 factor [Flavobacterium sp. F-30]